MGKKRTVTSAQALSDPLATPWEGAFILCGPRKPCLSLQTHSPLAAFASLGF